MLAKSIIPIFQFRKLVDYCGSGDNPVDCHGNGICVNTDASVNGYVCYCEPGYDPADDCETSKHNFSLLY